jgi:hypothetical protein
MGVLKVERKSSTDAALTLEYPGHMRIGGGGTSYPCIDRYL